MDAQHPTADEPDRVQRFGAYALCLDGARLDGARILLTRLTDTDLWTLPGGGIDHGEDVRTAAIREVYEETGLPLTIGELLEVDSVHFTGRSPSGRLEDFHAIRVIFAGTVPTDVEPRVVEVDGSTAEVAWVDLADLQRLHVAGLVRVALGRS